jgi:hypothetical protein
MTGFETRDVKWPSACEIPTQVSFPAVLVTSKFMTKPEVSLVICTYNRCELLRQTLESIARLRPPAGLKWEVLVVDNNCSRRHATRWWRRSPGDCR